ncbi:P-loop NTPase family protein [Burkholderia cenocepacia]|uniref:PRK13886 family protein n=1 Tax=Burkholderia cenocepacia TaxID=95486 RepID=UPI002ABE4DB7|nr:conjugal transfer protein TraL [Burkholderia cenocepacia]
MANVHITLQGKGGVGKSFSAVNVAQFKRHKGQKPKCIDTDPVNATFAGFNALDVVRLEIMDGDEINSRHFDALVEMIATTTDDVVIDNGASSFVPLSHYLISNQVPSLLHEMGHQLIVHTSITGGQSLVDTVNGFAQIARQFPPETRIVVWLNPYWGPVEHEGKGFEQLKAYRENKDRVSAIIQVPTLKDETYGRDLTEMLQERLTFDQAIASPTRTIMARQRLKIIRDQLYAQLENAAVL